MVLRREKGRRRQPLDQLLSSSPTPENELFPEKAGSSSDEFCTAELVELYKIEFGI